MLYFIEYFNTCISFGSVKFLKTFTNNKTNLFQTEFLNYQKEQKK